MCRTNAGYNNMGLDAHYDRMLDEHLQDDHGEDVEIACECCRENYPAESITKRKDGNWCSHCKDICADCGEHSPKGLKDIGPNAAGMPWLCCPTCVVADKAQDSETMNHPAWR